MGGRSIHCTYLDTWRSALHRALGRMLWLLGSLIWAQNAQLHLPSTYDRVQLAPKTRCPTKYCGCHRVKKRHWVTKQLSCILHWLCVKKSVHAAQRAGCQVANSVSKHRKLSVCENKDSLGRQEGCRAAKSVHSEATMVAPCTKPSGSVGTRVLMFNHHLRHLKDLVLY